MRLVQAKKIHIIDESFDAIELIRKHEGNKQTSDAAVYICNLSDIVRKHKVWQQYLPRVIPFYGK